IHRNACPLVGAATLGAAGLRAAAETVLGTERSDDLQVVACRQVIDDVAGVREDAGRVGEHADTAAAQGPPALLRGDLGTGANPAPVPAVTAMRGVARGGRSRVPA